MKNSEIALVVLLAAISVLVSYWLGNLILGDPNDEVYKITYVEEISGTIDEPDIETFNPTALNPTVEVLIGDCGVDEKYDEELRKCVSKNEKNDKDKKDDGKGEDKPEPDNPEE